MVDGESLALELIVCLIFVSITAAIAHAKGRNAIGYFFVGFFFFFFGLVLAPVDEGNRFQTTECSRDSVKPLMI